MKKAVILCLLLFSIGATSQNYLTPDTIHRHEISASVLPLINVFSGSVSGSSYINFNFGYKYHFKNRFVFRSALVLFPNGVTQSNTAGLVFYYSTVGYKNIFFVQDLHATVKSQLNIGFGKEYKFNRLIHSFGLDAFVNHVKVKYGEHFYYRYPNQNLTYSFVTDSTKYTVDTLGYEAKEKRTGVGVQAFYAVKYKISKQWYVSVTIGPSFNFSFVNGSRYENRTQQSRNYTAYDFVFPNVGFISDVSICYRF